MGTNDHSIIRAVLAGNKDAYGALVARHSRVVFRVAYRILGNEADAEDAVQETFLRGYLKLPDFESRSNFGTWIYRIAVNCALDMVGKRPVSASQIEEEPDPEQKNVQVPDVAAGPERLLLSREIGSRQQELMAGLTAVEHTAFVLRHMEDCPIDEIAAALGVSANAAKQAVFRAVQKLRRGLAPLRE